MNILVRTMHLLVRGIMAAVQYSLLTLGIVTLLFVMLNVIAQKRLDEIKASVAHNVFDDVLSPETAAGIVTLQRIFNVATPEAALARVKSAPSFEMHPNLHYMTQRIDNPYYRIGLEGIRYDQGWNDDYVRQLLSSGKDLVFLMGGSTMLGHGVACNETISWNVNKDLSKSGRMVALNFGSQAYDLQREIDKLVYLLRSGYRPKHVVFLDGWNDVVGLSRSNMRWQDKIIYHGFSVNRGEIAFTPGARTGAPNYERLMINSLPIMRYLETRIRPPFDVDAVERARD
ncbi:MAG: hypothetical protein NT115_12230, partial [Proteobacteria bacterium]|nr:hypothetical protein [Pseudomonadota bacterium]